MKKDEPTCALPVTPSRIRLNARRHRPYVLFSLSCNQVKNSDKLVLQKQKELIPEGNGGTDGRGGGGFAHS